MLVAAGLCQDVMLLSTSLRCKLWCVDGSSVQLPSVGCRSATAQPVCPQMYCCATSRHS